MILQTLRGLLAENAASIARADIENSMQSESSLREKAAQDFAILYKNMLRSSGRKGPIKILEVGPGRGHLSKMLAELGHQLDALDFTSTYLESFESLHKRDKKNKTRGEFFVQNIEEFESKGSYDLVVACDVLEHLTHPQDALLAIYESLRPGGLVYIRVPSYEPLLAYSLRLGCPWVLVHLRTYTEQILRLELRSTGFQIKKGPRRLAKTAKIAHPSLSSKSYWRNNKAALQDTHFLENEATNQRKDRLQRAFEKLVLFRLFGKPSEIYVFGRKE